MADYKEMYLRLSRKVNQAVILLQEIQQETEEMYISAEDEPLVLLVPDDANRVDTANG